MQKKAKKLQLHRETLRNLTENNLKEAVGGITVRTCPTYTQAYATCDCSIPTTIFCCG